MRLLTRDGLLCFFTVIICNTALPLSFVTAYFNGTIIATISLSLNNEWRVEKCAEFILLVEMAWPLRSKDVEKYKELFFALAVITCCY